MYSMKLHIQGHKNVWPEAHPKNCFYEAGKERYMEGVLDILMDEKLC